MSAGGGTARWLRRGAVDSADLVRSRCTYIAYLQDLLSLHVGAEQVRLVAIQLAPSFCSILARGLIIILVVVLAILL